MNKIFRRNGKKIYIKSPQYEDVEFVRELWSDYDSMKEFGGTFYLNDEKWRLFYKNMVYPTDKRNYYTLVYNYDDKPIGEASFHGYDSATQMAELNIKIKKQFRTKEIVEEAIKLIIEFYFYEFCGSVLIEKTPEGYYYDSLISLGFQVIDKGREFYTLKLTEGEFGSRKKSCCKKIAVLLFDEFDLLSLGNMVGPFEGEENVDIEYISMEKDKVQSKNVITVNTKLYDGDFYDLMLIPNSLKILNYLNTEGYLENIKKLYEKSALILTCDMSNLIMYEIFKDTELRIPLEENLYHIIKDRYKHIKLVNEEIIEYEKMIMLRTFKDNSGVVIKVKNRILQNNSKK